jgi:hypothetical protein
MMTTAWRDRIRLTGGLRTLDFEIVNVVRIGMLPVVLLVAVRRADALVKPRCCGASSSS